MLLSMYSILWFPSCLAIVFALASTPVFRLADTAPTYTKERNGTIDGLRGILALGVFFHHVAVYAKYLQTGIWTVTPDRFYFNLGPAGVSVFFMITGYLFWMQMLSAKGRPDLVRLYISRVFRIVPLYTVLAIVVFIIAGIETGWTRRVDSVSLLIEILRWLSGGLFVSGSVNGFVLAAAMVTWTLQYEWFFYFSLSITRIFARNTVMAGFFTSLSLLVSLAILSTLRDQVSVFVAMFSVGMVVATGQFAKLADPLKLPGWAQSAIATAAVVYALLSVPAYSISSIICLGIFFAYVARGATLFGLLTTRPAKRLGDVSYGLYLLQGPVLFLAYSLPVSKALSAASPLGHWTVAALSACALVAIATLSHAYVERPAIEFGRGVWRRVSSSEWPVAFAREAAPVE